ncbi:MAG: hydroxyacylglutathione hydrolase [Rubellimicrobium sp.]|nr:hydroxyacylglutathione hydrolase [Rubellimicrobium sp.]
MSLELVTVPCRADNYAFLLHDAATGQTALVDAPEAAPIQAALSARGWRLTDILLTHHHGDHVEGVDALRSGARVIGAAGDAHRLPPLDLAVAPGDAVTVCGEAIGVIDVPGHTVGHIAFHFPETGAVMTGDSLMALGCGRLFEGTAAQMWDSLSRLARLPPETIVCSGHEYTLSNARFALSVDPDNPALQARAGAVEAARSRGEATVPSSLAEELATNPFLRAGHAYMKARMGLPAAPDKEVFAAIRAAKDRF